MRIEPLPLAGACLIELSPIQDERGFFARSFCQEIFAAHGLCSSFCQQSVSFNPHVSTLRGLHYQAAPHTEIKLIRCVRGRVFDVIVDIRIESPTFGQWFGVELSAENHRQIYVPAGFAHGFQTLAPDSELFYQMSAPYHPESSRGIFWQDPALGIDWPDPSQAIVSVRDAALPPLAAPGVTGPV